MKTNSALGERRILEAQLGFAQKDRFVFLSDSGFVLLLPAKKHKADDSHLLSKVLKSEPQLSK